MIFLLVAIAVKPSPMFPIKGTHVAVSRDGKTLASADGKQVSLFDADSGKKTADVTKVGQKPGPLLAVGDGFVVQLLGEKKKRFALISGGKASEVPFRLPKDIADVPALNVAYSGATMVGLLTPSAELTDVLAWDFAARPPVESPRTGLSTHCWSVWASNKKARVLCEDGLHTFDMDPPGNNNQVGAPDESLTVTRDAITAGDGERVTWIAGGEILVDDFSGEPRMKKSAKLSGGSMVTALTFVPGMKTIAVSLSADGVVWLWDYATDSFTKVKVPKPTQLVVSDDKGKVWVRSSAGVVRLDIGD